MIRFLIQIAVFLGSAAVGLLVASMTINGVNVKALGFISAVVIYAVIQAVITPFLMKIAAKKASAFLGGTGLVATFLALLAASQISNGLTIRGGVTTWVSVTLVVWLVTAVATLMLPYLLVKAGVQRVKENRS